VLRLQQFSVSVGQGALAEARSLHDMTLTCRRTSRTRITCTRPSFSTKSTRRLGASRKSRRTRLVSWRRAKTCAVSATIS
jgi:hypothetical protein